MRRLAKVGAIFWVLLLGLIVFGVFALPDHGMAASPLALQNRDGQDVVGALNSEGLADFREIGLGRDYPHIALSPLTRWYTRFIVSMGSNDRPSLVVQDEAKRFTHAFGAVRGRRIASRIWVDDSGTTYTRDAADALMRTLGATTVQLDWALGTDIEPPIDGDIRGWAGGPQAPSGDMPASAIDRFLELLNWSRYSHDASNRPFNAVTAFSQTATFDTVDSAAPGTAIRIPYYSADGIQGFRLDSSRAALSLYLFYGSAPGIQRFQSSLDLPRWRDIDSHFKRAVVPMSAIPLAMDEMFSFDPGSGRSFGTVLDRPISRSAIERMNLVVADGKMRVGILSGIEGQSGDPNTAIVDIIRVAEVRFHSKTPVAYLLVDDATGAPIIVGASLDAH